MICKEFSFRIKPFYPSGGKLITHLFYVDGLLLFANGGVRSVQNIMKMLHTYEAISGQLVSFAKSYIFFPKHFALSWKSRILRDTDFLEGKWPCKYLGVPLYVGKLNSQFLDPLLSKVQNKLVGWKSNILSFGGKITLIKNVLSNMPIHILFVMNIPKGIFKWLKSIFSNFLCGSRNVIKKRHWVSWRRVCLPVEEGGLGIRDLSEVESSLLINFLENCW